MLFLLTGASGAGKSSARQAIETDLAPVVECVELRHLGPVPAVPDVAWRQRMAECAVARAARLDVEGRDLLLAGDPVAPGEVLAAPSAPVVDIAVCLLDVDEATQQRRLRVIDGSALTVTEVGDRVRAWIDAVRAGSAPVFRRSAE